MADMRRRAPEPPPGPPGIEFKPGLAQNTLRELAPLLAEEGIDPGNIDATDPATFQAALTPRSRTAQHDPLHPVGHARDLAAATLRQAIQAIAHGDTALAAAILDQAEPESPDGTAPTVAACIGVALGLLDDWLTGASHHTPPGLASASGCPPGTGPDTGPQPTSSS